MYTKREARWWAAVRCISNEVDFNERKEATKNETITEKARNRRKK